MRKSTNYGLKLMEGTDNVKRQDFVDNFEIIDREMKNNDTSMKDIANDSYPIVEATGTNAYVGSTDKITKLSKGTRCTLFIGTNATGNCSLNLNNYGAKNIKDNFGSIVTNLKANIPYNLCYNGSDFILQGKGGGGNATADKVLSGSTFTNDSGAQIGSMSNRGAPVVNLNCGGTFNLQEGYYSGGQAIANSLASQTQGNATASQILAGFSAWVNGSKVAGNATMESLGGKRFVMGRKVSVYTGAIVPDFKFYHMDGTLISSSSVISAIDITGFDFTPTFAIIYNLDPHFKDYAVLYNTEKMILRDGLRINTTLGSVIVEKGRLLMPVATQREYAYIIFS